MLKSLFSRRSARQPPVAKVQAELVKQIEKVDTIPTLSDTVVRAMSLATDPQTTLGDFANLIRRDATLTFMLLRRANSAASGGSAADIRQAVVRLGMKTCARLITTMGMNDLLRSHSPAVRERCESLLRHCLFAANISTHLNRALNVGFVGQEFTGGLLHDIGRLLISAKSPELAPRADPIDFDERADVLARERAALGTDHCQVGGLFAAANNLPPAIAQVILKHHDPADASEHRGLVALVAVADDLANYVQRTRRVADYDGHETAAYVVLSERWLTRHHHHFRDQLPALVKDALRDTRETLKAVSD